MKNIALKIGDQFFGIQTYGGSHGSVGGPFQNLTGISDIVSLFIKISFALAGLILLFYFIFGGIGMIASAGQSDPQKLESARKTLTSAILGFIIVFASYWIVKLIGTLIGMPNLI